MVRSSLPSPVRLAIVHQPEFASSLHPFSLAMVSSTRPVEGSVKSVGVFEKPVGVHAGDALLVCPPELVADPEPVLLPDPEPVPLPDPEPVALPVAELDLEPHPPSASATRIVVARLRVRGPGCLEQPAPCLVTLGTRGFMNRPSR
jgi:hypothetical protein